MAARRFYYLCSHCGEWFAAKLYNTPFGYESWAKRGHPVHINRPVARTCSSKCRQGAYRARVQRNEVGVAVANS